MTSANGVDDLLDAAEENLQILEDTFGADHRLVRKAFSRFTEATKDADPFSCRLAAAYLEWCKAHPDRVDGLPRTKACRCELGFILDDPEELRYRPCPKCLPKTADKWAGFDEKDLDPDERSMI